MMQERYPLRNGETTSIEFLFGLTSEMERAKRDLRNRLEKTGQTRLFREIDTKLQNVLTKLLSTVPEHKIRTLRANLDYQEIKIVTKGYAVDDGFTRVRAGALQDLCAFASKEKCAMCFGEGAGHGRVPVSQNPEGIDHGGRGRKRALHGPNAGF